MDVTGMDATGSQGVQAGDGGVQINLFAGEQPRGPVVAGNVPQAPPGHLVGTSPSGPCFRPIPGWNHD
jgi:hypothetical protein